MCDVDAGFFCCSKDRAELVQMMCTILMQDLPAFRQTEPSMIW